MTRTVKRDTLAWHGVSMCCDVSDLVSDQWQILETNNWAI